MQYLEFSRGDLLFSDNTHSAGGGGGGGGLVSLAYFNSTYL